MSHTMIGKVEAFTVSYILQQVCNDMSQSKIRKHRQKSFLTLVVVAADVVEASPGELLFYNFETQNKYLSNKTIINYKSVNVIDQSKRI